jgi:hypothetical protein
MECLARRAGIDLDQSGRPSPDEATRVAAQKLAYVYFEEELEPGGQSGQAVASRASDAEGHIMAKAELIGAY